ncbi:homoserine kinase [Candidatus Uhrbacteria bacterium]|nr:homoserine kinase [Candidatus Uhrbacteria bacterium]
MNSCSAFAPASVANVGPGFDVFGFALEGAGDTVTARRSDQPGVRLLKIEGDGGRLPVGADNIVCVVAAAMLRAANPGFGIELFLFKGLPLGSGLGSSSASAVAAAAAVNGLLVGAFDNKQLLEFAREGERAACGAAHADNVAASLYGGFTMVAGEPPEVSVLKVPASWHAAVVHPHLELPTKKARAVISPAVSLANHTATLAAAARLVAGIAGGDLAMVGRSVMGDRVATPARAGLIPHYEQVVAAALQKGAAGASISGAGPSIFALTEGLEGAKVIADAMASVWRARGIECDIIVSRMGAPGARLAAEVPHANPLTALLRPLHQDLSAR